MKLFKFIFLSRQGLYVGRKLTNYDYYVQYGTNWAINQLFSTHISCLRHIDPPYLNSLFFIQI